MIGASCRDYSYQNWAGCVSLCDLDPERYWWAHALETHDGDDFFLFLTRWIPQPTTYSPDTDALISIDTLLIQKHSTPSLSGGW